MANVKYDKIKEYKELLSNCSAEDLTEFDRYRFFDGELEYDDLSRLCSVMLSVIIELKRGNEQNSQPIQETFMLNDQPDSVPKERIKKEAEDYFYY